MSDSPAVKAARAEGWRIGAAKERARCMAIIESPEAVSRDRQALHLATQTDMTVEQARAHLATLPADPQPLPDGTAGDEQARGAEAFRRARTH